MNHFLAALLPACLLATEPLKDAKESAPVVIDGAGKEVTLAKWKLVGGTRKLGWVAEKPEAFELREFGSTLLKDGVLTLVPLGRLQSVRYDYEKETCSVHVAGLEKPLEGPAKYKDTNTITVEAEVEGKDGVADLRYRGGVLKGGIREIRFPGAKPAEAPKGELFSVRALPDGKGKPGAVHAFLNAKALYRLANGTEKPLPYLLFKKTLKVEIAKIAQMHLGEFHVKERTSECEVKLTDGTQLSVTLLTTAIIDGKPATLLGLLGEVTAGWKLAPANAITEFRPGELKPEEPKEEEPKKKEPAKKKGPVKEKE
jgi:hypothetical protein